MKIAIQMVLFVIAFILIYGALHYYVFYRMSSLLTIKKNWIWYAVLSLAIISYPLAMMIERYSFNTVTKSFYYITSAWMGLLFLLFSLLVFFELVNFAYKAPPFYAGVTLLSLAILFTFAGIWNGQRLTVKNIEISLPNVSKDIRIVQLSDIHLGTIHQKPYLEKIVKQTNALNPDIIVLTGDLVDGSAPLSKEMIAPLNDFKAPVYYIIGNHEVYEGLDKVMNLLKDTKLIILRNKAVSAKNLTFLGIDYAENRTQLPKALASVNFSKEKPVILLYHSPTMKADVLEQYGISLHLAGHTHDGQIFPFNLLVHLVHPYATGLHYSTSKKTAVYVTPGTGTWGPPMRLGSSNEITLINLKNSTEKISGNL